MKIDNPFSLPDLRTSSARGREVQFWPKTLPPPLSVGFWASAFFFFSFFLRSFHVWFPEAQTFFLPGYTHLFFARVSQ